METQRIVYLLERYIAALLTEEEKQELALIMHDPDHENLVQAELLRLLQEEGGPAEPGQEQAGRGANWDPVLQRVLSVDKKKHLAPALLPTNPRRWMAAAAIVLILLGGGALYIFT